MRTVPPYATSMLLLLALVTAPLAGCSPLHPLRATRAAPADLAQWTLEQTDLGRIHEARLVLQQRMTPSDPDRQTTAEALEALLTIHQQLAAGWPGLEPTPELSAHGDDAASQAAYLVRSDYFLFARAAHEAYEVRDGVQQRMFRDAFHQVRPDAENTTQYRAWLNAGWRFGLVDPDAGT